MKIYGISVYVRRILCHTVLKILQISVALTLYYTLFSLLYTYNLHYYLQYVRRTE